MLSKLTIQLILKEPFYGHFLSGLLKAFSDKVATLSLSMGLGESYKLLINPDFWQNTQLAPEKQYGLLKHEVLHLVFKHILTIREFENKRIFNIAADLVVNQYLAGSQLPTDAITLGLFPDLNLKKDASVGYYYGQLLQAWQKVCTQKLGDLSTADKNLRQLILEGHPHLAKHQSWEKAVEKFSQAELRVMEGMLNEAIGTVAKRVGDQEIGFLPASLKTYLQPYYNLPPAQINWRRILRLFTSGSSQTFLKNTIRKPSKRYGTIPGIKIKHRTKLLVAVDTSGSIHHQDLELFFSEIYHIWRQGTEIRVVECDVRIHHDYFFEGQKPQIAGGGGGTDFNAPIALANQTYRPDALIYFTDGFGPVPRTPSRYPILWMITSTGITATTEVWRRLPGRKVKMGE